MAPETVDLELAGVYGKLMQARIALQGKKLSKSGRNTYAGYNYFELGDFLPVVQEIFLNLGLCGYITYTAESARLTIVDTADGSEMVIETPMSEAHLKGAHPIQNLGAVQTYLRRYLWVTAMEIVEHDALDATLGKDEDEPRGRRTQNTPQPKPATRRREAEQQPTLPVQQEAEQSGDGDETEAFVAAAYEKMADCGLDKNGIMTLLTVLKVEQLDQLPVTHRNKLLKMLTPDYAKLLNMGKNSKGEQIVELPEENVDAPSVDELEQQVDDLI
jgi:hypothetical protein